MGPPCLSAGRFHGSLPQGAFQRPFRGSMQWELFIISILQTRGLRFGEWKSSTQSHSRGSFPGVPAQGFPAVLGCLSEVRCCFLTGLTSKSNKKGYCIEQPIHARGWSVGGMSSALYMSHFIAVLCISALITPSYRWGIQGTERLRNLPEVTQQAVEPAANPGRPLPAPTGLSALPADGTGRHQGLGSEFSVGSLVTSTSWGGCDHYPRFTGEGTEAQRGLRTHVRSHGQSGRGRGPRPVCVVPCLSSPQKPPSTGPLRPSCGGGALLRRYVGVVLKFSPVLEGVRSLGGRSLRGGGGGPTRVTAGAESLHCSLTRTQEAPRKPPGSPARTAVPPAGVCWRWGRGQPPCRAPASAGGRRAVPDTGRASAPQGCLLGSQAS